jgi:hypothetical protein
MRFVLLLCLLLLSGCYYPYYGYPYYGAYPYGYPYSSPYPAYTPGYQPYAYGPSAQPPFSGAPYPGIPQQYSSNAPSAQGGPFGPPDPQNCGTPYEPKPCSRRAH